MTGDSTSTDGGDTASATPEVVLLGSAATVDVLADAMMSAGLHARCTIAREPIIELHAAPEGSLDDATSRLRDGEVEWLVFLSRPAVQHLTRALVATEDTPPLVCAARADGARARVAVVGERTAEAARAMNWTVDVVGPDGTAAGLVRKLCALPAIAGQRMLVPRSELGHADVLEPLAAAGAELITAIAYHNAAAAVDANAWCARSSAARGADLIAVFLSSSSVDALAMRLRDIDPTPTIDHARMVAMGHSTAKTIEAHGWHVAAIAEPHTIDGVVAAVARLLDEA